jgi:DNA-binding XRE family transcriptional regulator
MSEIIPVDGNLAQSSSSSTANVSIIWIIYIIIICVFISFAVRVFRALLKYLKSKDVRKEKTATRISLGEAIKKHRTQCKMTQEFVAEALGVSRQAVSKWETGTSDPSTSNLIALAKLYGISAEELIKELKE